jgi:4'-phosphopantetheinyl transferase
MSRVGWLTRGLADVPEHDRWLSEREREDLATLRTDKRRSEWRLGRWAAKGAVASWRQVPLAAVEVFAAEDGAPEALVDGKEAPVALSLSHRRGRALAAVCDAPAALGCDLEAVEPRSAAFTREWLGPAERLRVAWEDGRTELGWWRREPSWVMTVVSDPAPETPPIELG